jgi:tripartite-type tricarboxylate transporter receptor subunit TctC
MRSGLAAVAVFVFALAACSEPSEYPAKDITIIVPFDSGGGFDTYVRALAPSLEAQFSGEINVLPRNVPGAGGRRGASEIYRARPDGYTIGILNMPGVLIPKLQGAPTEYDLSHMTWLATLGYDSYVFVIKGDSPWRSIDDLKALGREITYGATGPGSTAFVATNIVNQTLAIPYNIVTGYKGSSAYLLGLIRGDFDAALVSYAGARSYLQSGDIKAIAIFGSDSDDPAIADAADLGVHELGNLRLVRMISAPPDLPLDIRTTLEQALLAAMMDADFEAWLAESGNDVYPAGVNDTERAVTEMTQFYDQYKSVLD